MLQTMMFTAESRFHVSRDLNKAIEVLNFHLTEAHAQCLHVQLTAWTDPNGKQYVGISDRNTPV